MKKIHLLLGIALLGLLTSCLKDQEDVFDESPAVRVEKAIAEDYRILASAQNGWLMKYFPATSKEFGGYNIILKFSTDGKVTAISEAVSADNLKENVLGPKAFDMYIKDKDAEFPQAESLYKISQSAGIVLSFDSYNDVFHLFSDPSAQLAGSTGEGMGGDYDFSILSASESKVELKGKKTGNYVTLTPFTGGDWGDYMAQVVEVEDVMDFPQYSMDVNGTKVDISSSYRQFTMNYPLGEQDTTIYVPYVVTPDGIQFDEPIEIAGQTISGYKFVPDALEFPSTDNASIILKGIVPPINETFANDLWATSMSNIGEFGQPYWNYIKTAIMPSLGEQLQYFYFGANGNYWGATFNSGGYGGVMGMSYELIGEDEISIVYNAAGNYSNGDWYVKNALFHFLIVPFGCWYDEASAPVPVKRTFKITTDNVKSPSEIILTDKDEPTNIIRLVNFSITDPLNN